MDDVAEICYRCSMEDTSPLRFALGLGIIAIGIAALLGALNIINFNELARTSWPLLFIAGGAILLVDSPKQNYLWAIILIGIGAVAQLNVLDIVDVNFWQLFWPVVLIAFGWSILVNRTGAVAAADDRITAFLSGTSNKSSSKDYKGGRVTAILGGSEIDLRKATIKEEATLDVLVIMGGVELRVPEDWEVRTSVTPILGDAENKAAAPNAAKAPILNIVGTVTLGGIEIKN